MANTWLFVFSQFKSFPYAGCKIFESRPTPHPPLSLSHHTALCLPQWITVTRRMTVAEPHHLAILRTLCTPPSPYADRTNSEYTPGPAKSHVLSITPSQATAQHTEKHTTKLPLAATGETFSAGNIFRFCWRPQQGILSKFTVIKRWVGVFKSSYTHMATELRNP